MNNFFLRTFLGTKGLNIKHIDENKFVIEDVFGVCSLPYRVENFSELSASSYKMARTVPLISQDGSFFSEIQLQLDYLFELEKYYVIMLSDYYRIWQCGKSNYRIYDQMQRFIPIAYGECGYGSGDKQILEYIHQATLKLLENDNSFITKDFLNLKLMHIQIDRICQDLISLLQRAINSYKSLLFCQRKVIKKQTERLSRLKANEIISYGQIDLSTSATIAVISLCTSLDLSSKLIYFLNNSQTPIKKFKSSQSKHFSDMESIKENVLSSDELNSIKNIWNKFPSIKSLIQFRHDLIHNTTSLELERLYVGKGTEEICNLSMNYCFQPWRDCEENGQPLRYLGRNYFVGYNIDFEKQLCNWLTDVIQGHLEVGESLLSWITDRSERVDFELDF